MKHTKYHINQFTYVHTYVPMHKLLELDFVIKDGSNDTIWFNMLNALDGHRLLLQHI